LASAGSMRHTGRDSWVVIMMTRTSQF